MYPIIALGPRVTGGLFLSAGAKRPRLLRGESRPRSGRSDRKSFGLLQGGIAKAVHQSVDGLAGFAHGAVPGLVALVVGQVVGVKDGVDPHPHELVGGGEDGR